ncbi:hypothetical protein [Nonomuraea sp. NPDC049141]|uniref:hypothetical protein n=1 Tax=Nonomuraea sp. NPDC049141 TaxID=3155500 RepID=UPI0033F383CF
MVRGRQAPAPEALLETGRSPDLGEHTLGRVDQGRYPAGPVDRLQPVQFPQRVNESGQGWFHFLVYDAKFVRRHDDDQPWLHAFSEAGPRGEYDHLRAGPPGNWPKPEEWAEGFDLTEADDRYSEINPYDGPKR